MRFVDLFAGLGGFHVALRQLGHECVFASEIDEGLRDLYFKNFGLVPEGDIRKVPIESIPAHDLLCAGSPCQPFSKAGDQYGFDCPKWGDLLERVIEILQHHKPQCFILAKRAQPRTTLPMGRGEGRCHFLGFLGLALVEFGCVLSRQQVTY